MNNILLVTLLLACNLVKASDSLEAELMGEFSQSLYLGIATNKSTVIAVGERGHVALSTDYGSTWQQAKHVPTRTTLTAVSMVGESVWAVGHDTTIIYSSDGGDNWIVQFEDKQRQMPLLDVMFINESDGFAIGAYGTYLTTFDGGKNWKDSLIVDDQDFHLNKIVQVDEFRYFVVAEAGNAYRSFDAGKNWELIELPYSGSMFGVVSYNNQVITYGLRGNVLVSDDFGDNFIQLKHLAHDSLFGSQVTLNNSLLIVGANGTILKYHNNNLKKVNMGKSDGDYTGLLSIKDNTFIFIGESGISTKTMGNE
ncbi:MAG: YCF48-related protein [Proteobacteria bacterium]|nr:YCF48-related protein [Pseudomonadota bacterium]